MTTTITITSDDITMNCCCAASPPPAAAAVLRPEDVYGLSCATVLPEHVNGAAPLSRQMVCAKAVLPAGRAITHLGVIVVSPAQGSQSGEARLAVYSDTGGLVAATANDPNLFMTDGWVYSPLDAPVPAEANDRMIWLAALVPSYSTKGPGMALVENPIYGEPDIYNPNGVRAFTQPDQTQLPPDIGGDYPHLTMLVPLVGVDLTEDSSTGSPLAPVERPPLNILGKPPLVSSEAGGGFSRFVARRGGRLRAEVEAGGPSGVLLGFAGGLPRPITD